ncbi:trehalose-phosphatase [Halopiger djelfimassiliensis]|uniref:trehalose-phosphatase n=1 Tax=Halopiger djelfimassiliensis TaxID=1293047 RepID=UPI0009DC05BA|nr:trehalose-phosphatase [Halopiger djelfimassiliensis]
MTDDSDSPPRPLREELPRIRERFADASRLLCCLDFDGTLAPIVDQPDDAVPLREAEAALVTLANEPKVSTAIVSGRALADVRDRIDGPSVYAGNHGLELAHNGSVEVHPDARTRAIQIERVCAVLETVLDPVPNARIENKRLTGTVHFRTVPPAARPVVRRLTRAVVERFGGDDLELSTGKRILEIEPAIRWGKGDAVEVLESAQPSDSVTIYVGDDVTDESAFRAIEPDGIGVLVGDAEPSAASCRVQSPEAVATFLEWLGTTGVELLGEADGNAAPIDPDRFDRPFAADRSEPEGE